MGLCARVPLLPVHPVHEANCTLFMFSVMLHYFVVVVVDLSSVSVNLRLVGNSTYKDSLFCYSGQSKHCHRKMLAKGAMVPPLPKNAKFYSLSLEHCNIRAVFRKNLLGRPRITWLKATTRGRVWEGD